MRDKQEELENYIFYLEERVDDMLEALSNAASDVSHKREKCVESTYAILEKALKDDFNKRQAFRGN